jgi:hypothetical protein
MEQKQSVNTEEWKNEYEKITGYTCYPVSSEHLDGTMALVDQ